MLGFVVRRSIPRFSLFLSLFALLAAGAWAQSYYGAVRGAVSDPTGASVAGAHVTLTNEGTGEVRSTLSNGSGQYLFSDVVPAAYTVQVESVGFKKFERKGITVGTQQEITADLKLEVGAITESVEVTEAAPMVETSNASQGQVVNNQQVTDLPNMGRNPFLLSKLVNTVQNVGNPGVQPHGRSKRLFADFHRWGPRSWQ